MQINSGMTTSSQLTEIAAAIPSISKNNIFRDADHLRVMSSTPKIMYKNPPSLVNKAPLVLIKISYPLTDIFSTTGGLFTIIQSSLRIFCFRPDCHTFFL